MNKKAKRVLKMSRIGVVVALFTNVGHFKILFRVYQHFPGHNNFSSTATLLFDLSHKKLNYGWTKLQINGNYILAKKM